jgi:hypothetical protein
MGIPMFAVQGSNVRCSAQLQQLHVRQGTQGALALSAQAGQVTSGGAARCRRQLRNVVAKPDASQFERSLAASPSLSRVTDVQPNSLQ